MQTVLEQAEMLSDGRTGSAMHMQLEVRGFKNQWSYVNWAGRINCSLADFVRAALTVGRTRAGRGYGHGVWSVCEAVYRASAVHLFFRHRRGLVAQSPAFLALEKTEKGGVSFLAGMTGAKIFCERVLGTGHVVHLARSKIPFTMSGVAGGPTAAALRPDLLVRLNGGTWFALEAKGRSKRQSGTFFSDTKGQAQTVNTVKGVSPPFAVATLTSFDAGGAVFLEAEDPEFPPRDSRIDVAFDADVALRKYYQPVLAMQKLHADGKTTDVLGHPCLLSRIPGIDVTVGIAKEVLDAISGGECKAEALDDFARTRECRWPPRSSVEELPQGFDPLRSLGSDGIAVVLGSSWRSLSTAEGIVIPTS